MRFILFSFLVSLTIISCSGNKPGNVIPADKMRIVLSDLYVAEAYSTMVNDSLHKQTNRNDDSLAAYYKTILAHHNLSIEDLSKSIDWYKKNPEELDSVYAKIIPELSKVQILYPAK